MRRQVAIDSRIAALANAQHGVVARWQLVALGLSGQAVDRRVSGSRLHLLHRGVSELEERFLAICDRHGLPRPNVNTRIEGSEVDFAWRDVRLVVEVDGYAYHRSPRAFEDDRARDVTLTVAGWTVLRFTWAQVTGSPAWVAGAIRRRLAS